MWRLKNSNRSSVFFGHVGSFAGQLLRLYHLLCPVNINYPSSLTPWKGKWWACVKQKYTSYQICLIFSSYALLSRLVSPKISTAQTTIRQLGQLVCWHKSWQVLVTRSLQTSNPSCVATSQEIGLRARRLPSEIRCLFCSEICFAVCTGNPVGRKKRMLRAAARGKRWLHYSSGRPDKPTAASIRWQKMWQKRTKTAKQKQF